MGFIWIKTLSNVSIHVKQVKNQKKIHLSNSLKPFTLPINCYQFSIVKWCKDAELYRKYVLVACWITCHMYVHFLTVLILSALMTKIIDFYANMYHHCINYYHLSHHLTINKPYKIIACGLKRCEKCQNSKMVNIDATISWYQRILCRSRTRSYRFKYICVTYINMACVVQHFSVRFFRSIL